jgi:dsDNA-binding SOS-regulon protein
MTIAIEIRYAVSINGEDEEAVFNSIQDALAYAKDIIDNQLSSIKEKPR